MRTSSGRGRRRSKGPLEARSAASLRPYGLTVEAWQELLFQQSGSCAICGKGGKAEHLSVDHDHSIQAQTGEIVVRGLLCRRCNGGLGRFEYSNTVLDNLVQYIHNTLKARSERNVG